MKKVTSNSCSTFESNHKGNNWYPAKGKVQDC